MSNGMLFILFGASFFVFILIGALYEVGIKDGDPTIVEAYFIGVKVSLVVGTTVYTLISLFNWLNSLPPLIK